jgi:thiamine pyrophosphate-dependent acetolactate synthase large subunit-like protein
LPGIDPVQIAAGFGCASLRVEKAAALQEALANGWRTDGPVLIDVPVDQAVVKLY